MKIHFRRRISNQKYSIILRSFFTDITSLKTSQIIGVNRKTTDRYFNLFRSLIKQSALSERMLVSLRNGIEVDESYFGPRRVRGKRGRGAKGKIIVLGILKRNGKVYCEIIKNTEKEAVMPIIKRVVQSGSDIYSDGWKSYNALAVYGYNHKKVKHSENEFARPDGTHINGVESYWSWTKRRLNKFNGVAKRHFYEYLLESEWRFNHRENMEKDLKALIRKS